MKNFKKFLTIVFLAIILVIGIFKTAFADDISAPVPVCVSPQTLVNNVCTDPVISNPTPTPTPDPASTPTPDSTPISTATTPTSDPTPVTTPTANVNLTIRDGNAIIFSNSVPLEPAGTINLNDSTGKADPSPLNSDSVIAMLNDVQKSAGLNLNFIYEYGSVYLKCINSECAQDAVGWEYAVNNNIPGFGMDQSILKDGDSVYLYFGQNHQINLSANSITTNDTLKVNAQNYHYQDNTWTPLTGVTIGLTQSDSNNPYSPKEIKTLPVDGNGQVTFTNIDAGSYNVGIKEDYYFPTESLTVTKPPVITPTIHGGGGSNENPVLIPIIKTKPAFDSAKALNFLITQQKDNGSFGEDLYTDWATIALASNSQTPKANLDKINKYLSENKLSGNLLTDYERQAMALMALGLNPYDTNKENYIKDIVLKFDGKQFGDVDADNDDIFALIVLQNAGYKQDETIISNTIDFILSKQKDDGSWDENVDLTGAGIEALSAFNQKDSSDLLAEKIKNALTKAETYLKQKQKDDGSWGNASSTSWALEGILALGEKPENWIINKNTPIDYFAANQDTDGGIKEEDIKSKIWETSYVLSAMSGKNWNQIMQKFEKPKINSLLENTLNNSNQNNFLNKIKKFQKPTQKTQKSTETAIEKKTLILSSQNLEKNQTQPEKQSFLKKVLGIIFNF